MCPPVIRYLNPLEIPCKVSDWAIATCSGVKSLVPDPPNSVNALHCAYHSLLVTAQTVGFEQTSFTVLEGESVEVCITLLGNITGPGPFDFNIFAVDSTGEIVIVCSEQSEF